MLSGISTAHVESVQDHAKALRRMTKMEEALEPEEIERLDEWLHKRRLQGRRNRTLG
jgi:hypothetical protein